MLSCDIVTTAHCILAGGVSRNNFIVETLATLLHTYEIERAVETESTLLGAAFLAGLAVGFWKDKAEIAALFAHNASSFASHVTHAIVSRTIERTFVAAPSNPILEGSRRRWQEAMSRVKKWPFCL